MLCVMELLGETAVLYPCLLAFVYNTLTDQKSVVAQRFTSKAAD